MSLCCINSSFERFTILSLYLSAKVFIINIEFENTFYLRDVIDILSTSIGVKVLNTPHYPMPINVSGYNDVFVGRIRRDNSIKNGLNLWVVADNIRKGAATNAVQILKDLICLK